MKRLRSLLYHVLRCVLPSCASLHASLTYASLSASLTCFVNCFLMYPTICLTRCFLPCFLCASRMTKKIKSEHLCFFTYVRALPFVHHLYTSVSENCSTRVSDPNICYIHVL